MRQFRGLLVSLSILGAGLIATYATLPVWLPGLVNRIAAPDLQIDRVSMQHPSWQRWVVSELELRYAPSQASAANDTQATLSRFLPSRLLSKLGTYQVTIERLRLHGPDWYLEGQAALQDQSLELNGQATLGGRPVTMSARVRSDDLAHLRLRHDQPAMEVTLSAQLSATSKPQEQLRARFRVHGKLPTWQAAGRQLNNAHAQMTGVARLIGQQVVLTIDQSSHLTAEQLTVDQLSVANARLSLRAPIEAVYSGGTLRSGPLRLTSNNFTVEHPQIELPRMRLTGTLNRDNGVVKGSIHLATRSPELSEQITLSAPFTYQIAQNTAWGQLFSSTVALSEKHRFLPALLPGWPLPADLSGGKLQLNGPFSWNAGDYQADLLLKLDDVAGFYQDMLFEQCTAEIGIHLSPGRYAAASRQVSVGQLDIGFPLESLQAGVEIDAQQLRVYNARAQTLGGVLMAREFHSTLPDLALQTSIRVEGVQLGQLLELENAIEGSGTLDGELPIHLGDNGLSVQAGKLRARPPGGTIRYLGQLPQNELTDNPQLQLALDALRNFHYKILDITADYEENGSLTLAARLEGRNPDMAESRPVHFNLKVRENVLALLKSLKLSRQLSEQLERRILERYQSK